MAAATQQLAKSSTPHFQQKPPFQGAGTSQGPQNRKLASKGAKSIKVFRRDPRPGNNSCFLTPVSSQRLNFALMGLNLCKSRLSQSPALLPCLGPDMSEECSLCPVQALEVYLAKTEDKCKNKELFFISYKDGPKGDLHVNTLSGWVRKLIHHVYQTAEGEVLPLSQH